MAKCLVTGGCGFVGSHIVDALIAANHEVIVLDNLSTGKLENLNPQAGFVEGDIRNPLLVNSLGKFDYIYHTAALARIKPSIDNPVESHEVNLDGSLNIFELAREHGSKVIFSSSSALYMGDSLPSKEKDHVWFKNPYAAQKYMCECYLHLYGDLYGLDWCILRYFNVFGERQLTDGAYAAVVGIFLEQRKKKKALTVHGKGNRRRDFTYVKDVAQANLKAMQWQGIYNIGSGKNYTMLELAKQVGGRIKYVEDFPGQVHETLADITKAKTAGWEPTLNIKDWVDANRT